MKQKIETPEKLLEIINGYRLSRIILSAHELDVFSTLDNRSLTAIELAKEIGTDPRATDRLMNSLVTMGLLEKNKCQFSNSEFSMNYLVKKSQGFIGNLSHQVHLWKTWSTLTDAVIAGESVTIKESIGNRGEAWVEAFLAAMHSRGKQARDVASLLDLSNVKEMLDVGGGSGIFSFEFIKRNPEIKSDIFDLPSVIPVTQKYIDKEGFRESVRTIPGDYLINDFSGSYDLILLSAIVHINSDEENRHLVQKCTDSLNPGGRLVIMDHIMNEDRTEPGIGALFAINMLVGTEKGDTYTEMEVRNWMQQSGLTEMTILKTKDESTVMMVGRRQK